MENCSLNVVINEFDNSAILVLNSDSEIVQEDVALLLKLQSIEVISKPYSISLSSAISDEDFVKIWNNFVDYFCQEFLAFSKNGIVYVIHVLVEKFRIISDLFAYSRFDLTKYMGLFGELCFINESYSKYGSKVIENWGQPGLQRIDFNFKNEIFEVKCIGERSDLIKLSSVTQLNVVNNMKLFLVVYRVKVDRGTNYCFKDLISAIRLQIGSNEVDQLKFNFILKKLKLFNEYDLMTITKNFTIVDTNYYLIDHSFPQFIESEGYSVGDLSLKVEILEKFKFT